MNFSIHPSRNTTETESQSAHLCLEGTIATAAHYPRALKTPPPTRVGQAPCPGSELPPALMVEEESLPAARIERATERWKNGLELFLFHNMIAEHVRPLGL